MAIAMARLRNKRMVVQIDGKVTALQHRGEGSGMFAARCNQLAHYLMGKQSA